MGNICRSIVTSGAEGLIIDIECHLSHNLPTIVIVGFAGRTVNEAKDRLRGAFTSSRLTLPRRRVTINLAPADIPKTDSALDLPIALAILTTSEQITNFPAGQVAVGELGLDGSVRAVRGIIGKLLSGRAAGIRDFIVPAANLAQARLVPGIRLLPVESLRQLYDHFAAHTSITPVNTGDGILADTDINGDLSLYEPQFKDVIGQVEAKRAALIAAAGGHNLLLMGPPGTGKSLLARALPSLLPPLNHEEMLEVTHLHSLASKQYEQLATRRPLRSPHHSTSLTALIGGGGGLRPGEISLSHRGVLLLDELFEFDRSALEALRQPLEERIITVSRARDSARFPANFIMVATANPCPCGYKGSDRQSCICSPAQLQRYRSKLSGPILDRIDLCPNMTETNHQKLLTQPLQTSEELYRDQIALARHRQAERYDSPTLLNGDLSTTLVRQTVHLSAEATSLLNTAAEQLKLSGRAYLRSVKVARTIADLDDSPVVLPEHVSEAIRYRWQPV